MNFLPEGNWINKVFNAVNQEKMERMSKILWFKNNNVCGFARFNFKITLETSSLLAENKSEPSLKNNLWPYQSHRVFL